MSSSVGLAASIARLLRWSESRFNREERDSADFLKFQQRIGTGRDRDALAASQRSVYEKLLGRIRSTFGYSTLR